MTGGTFLNGVMLAGVGGAALPLVLHLLSRSRYRSVEWGAMMFLQDVDARGEVGARAKQWVLLALRMAIVALLAIALARPVIAGRWGGHAGASAVDVVIVLDRSASMATPESGRPRFDLAKEAVLQILSSLRKGDRVALVTVGDATTLAPPPLTPELQAAAARVADLRVSAGATDFASELLAALASFDGRSRARRQLYVVTDGQSSGWSRVNVPFTTLWRQRIAQLGGTPPQLHVIPVGGESLENVAVESLRLLDPPAVAGTPATIEVTLRNYGPAPRDRPLLVRAPGAALYSDLVSVPAGASRAVRFSTMLKTTGPQILTAEIRSDVLADDRAQLVVDVTPPISVLVVSGDESAEPARGESRYLRAALMPFAAAGRSGGDVATVEIKSWDQWHPGPTTGHHVLVLANVPEPTQSQARSIEQFVYAGGGLLVAPGNLARPERYNATLRRDTNTVLPAALEAPDDVAATVSIAPVERGHPVSLPFLAGSAQVRKHLRAHVDSTARVLARYSNGDPFLVESAYGGGRVILATTALDADWGALPLTADYLPLMQSIVKRLASAAIEDRNLQAGEDLRGAFDGAVDGGKATVTLPNGTRRSLDAVLFAGRSEVRFDGTDLPGIYTLRGAVEGKERALQYVVRPAAAESDPAPLAASRWAELEALLDLSRIDTPNDALAAALTEVRTGRELWAGMLAGVIVLGLVEMMLARRWSAGAN
jgi:hypothetical protein